MTLQFGFNTITPGSSTYIKIYNNIAGITKITRRYFAVNGFDGVITSIGILLGNYINAFESAGIGVSYRFKPDASGYNPENLGIYLFIGKMRLHIIIKIYYILIEQVNYI